MLETLYLSRQPADILKKKTIEKNTINYLRKAYSFVMNIFMNTAKQVDFFFLFFLLKQLFSELKIRQNSPPLSTHTHSHAQILGEEAGKTLRTKTFGGSAVSRPFHVAVFPALTLTNQTAQKRVVKLLTSGGEVQPVE